MNVGIFNRVNSKIKEGDGMYSEWKSLPLEGGGQGVLGAVGGREVVLAVVRQLASHQPSPLTTDEEVEWVLEVIRFGLSLPLSEHEALRDCVRVCCSWLSALLPPAAPAQPPPPAVPPALAAQPHRYANKILNHLHNLFIPRPNESGNLISKQAVLCHRVLRLARSLADSASLGPREWRSLLLLLLAAAAALLAPPAPLYGAAEQLCERVLCVLFEVWILACHRCFPSPSLWRTLREQCVRWRHRAPLTEQWARVSLCLTARLLVHMYGPMYPAVPISEEDSQLVPADMSAEAVTQAWYRILHTIGNPVDLTRPALISHTPEFLQYWMTVEEGQDQGREVEGRDSWVGSLAHIFHRAMMGVAAHVDAFLGRSTERWVVETVGGAGGLAGAGGPGGGGGPGLHDEGDLTPPAHRRLAKSFSASRPREKVPDKSTPRSSLIGLTSGRPSSVAPTTPPNSITSQVSECEKPPPSPLRPQVNSILHLFGDWLLDAALVGSNLQTHERAEGTPPPPSLSEAAQKITMINYQAGRCVALGALCRVLCSKQGREAVLAPYLARAYSALQRALRDPRAAAAVVLHAADIFRVDLDGVLVLVPDFINALERVLTEREPRLDCGHVDRRELRKAAISILLSLVAFPYHYRGLPVPEFPGYNEYAGMCLGEFARGRLSVVAACAVQTEPEEALAVPLLSALYLCVRHNACASDKRARSESAGPSVSSDDFAADVRELDPSSPSFGSSLVVRATYLVCHRLISSWKGDLQVSLAALELLSGLAKLHASKPDFYLEAMERSRAVRWMCDYIVAQCGRPPPGHSRDVHSCVVGAYGALAAWLCAPLLADGECLAALLEVVELGISGCRSRGDRPAMKDDKELKPVSMRVRDAAEALLMLILEQVGESTSEGRWCRLDERWLQELGHAPLRHFSLDGHILLSLLEEPLANSQEPQPTVVVIIRSSWGRWSWSLCSRGAPRCATLGGSSCPRPVAMLEPPARPPATCRALPAAPPCALESSFPSLEAVLRRLNDPGAATLFKLLEQQTNIEKKVRDGEDKALPEEYVPPEPVTEFQTARLFLAHFGLLNIGGEKKGAPPRLVSLSGGEALQAALRRLDATGARAALTAHVFYARRGQTRADQIVANAARSHGVSPAFVRMLRGLGSPVFVATHAGWSGHVRTSYDAASPAATHAHTRHTEQSFTPSLYDGREQVLYWADATDEIAFVVPSGRADDEHVDGPCLSTNRSDSTEKSGGSWWDVSGGVVGGVTYERSVSESERGEKRTLDNARALSLDLDKPQPALPGHGTGSGRRNRDFAPKILIIWLEDFEDHLNMPIDDLISYCETGVPCRRSDTAVLCVSAVRSGLVRVGVSGGAGGAGGAAGVLADGALVAPRLLPDCLRRAACFLARRARLNTDLYQPPPVRRRQLIQEISQQFKRDLSEPELLESLFKAP
ncbi:ral GTPase-activating protein subunit beta isoform X2 [Danaus plexippus]|uniref:ral GTPase-activating protein subunit beta isoform X2 n=1 Tax=Danaus plexippus TaxID=13037 RepID=UPI002AB2549D|nr:ral GTPase-activating protein subunit beta isoform X2 [Danaus plexippus]